MHPDRKIGIAMGILLVGVVAALFFRNEPLAVEEGLSSQREDELNQKLRDRDVAVYLDPDAELEQSVSTGEPQWTLPELLEKVNHSDAVPIPIGAVSPVAAPVEATPVEIAKRDPERFRPPTASDAAPASTVQQATNPSERLLDGVAASSAAEPEKKVPEPNGDFQEYTVKFGDTLSEISEKFLGSQGRYREIYEMNKDRMSSPDRLRVGRAIRVPRTYR